MKSGEQFRLKIFDSLNKANHVQSDTEIFYIIDGVLELNRCAPLWRERR